MCATLDLLDNVMYVWCVLVDAHVVFGMLLACKHRKQALGWWGRVLLWLPVVAVVLMLPQLFEPSGNQKNDWISTCRTRNLPGVLFAVIVCVAFAIIAGSFWFVWMTVAAMPPATASRVIWNAGAFIAVYLASWGLVIATFISEMINVEGPILPYVRQAAFIVMNMRGIAQAVLYWRLSGRPREPVQKQVPSFGSGTNSSKVRQSFPVTFANTDSVHCMTPVSARRSSEIPNLPTTAELHVEFQESSSSSSASAYLGEDWVDHHFKIPVWPPAACSVHRYCTGCGAAPEPGGLAPLGQFSEEPMTSEEDTGSCSLLGA